MESRTGTAAQHKAPQQVALNGAEDAGTEVQDRVEVAGVTISNPHRLLYREQGITKHQLAHYYQQIAEWILPHLIARPVTLVRCPSGAGGKCFYQKHLTDSLPGELVGVMIQEREKREKYPVIDSLAGLISLIQHGVLEFHPWPARVDALERPDRLVFDLDPGEGAEWSQVVQGARELGDRLTQLGLEPFLRTTGGKGLHVVVPLTRRNSWEELKDFAKKIADLMASEGPDDYTATMSKTKRIGKVFIDYLRNQRGATSIASYSTRARRGAPVATPIFWNELSSHLKSDAFNVSNIFQRISQLKADPWVNFFHIRQSLTRKMFSRLEH